MVQGAEGRGGARGHGVILGGKQTRSRLSVKRGEEARPSLPAERDKGAFSCGGVGRGSSFKQYVVA